METQVIFTFSALEEDILTILRSQDDIYGLQIIKYLDKAHKGQKKIKKVLYTQLYIAWKLRDLLILIWEKIDLKSVVVLDGSTIKSLVKVAKH